MNEDEDILDDNAPVTVDLPEPEEAAPKEQRRLSEADFAAARELYELGTKNMAQLAEQFNVSRQTLSKRFRDAGATYGSRSHEVAAATAAGVKSASVAAAVTFEDQRPERLEETRQQGFQLLKQAKLVGQKIVADTLKAGKPLETVDGDLKALGRYTKIQLELLEGTLKLLRADEFEDEAALPSFTVQDLTLGDIMDHMERNGADPDPTNINLDGIEGAK